MPTPQILAANVLAVLVFTLHGSRWHDSPVMGRGVIFEQREAGDSIALGVSMSSTLSYYHHKSLRHRGGKQPTRPNLHLHLKRLPHVPHIPSGAHRCGDGSEANTAGDDARICTHSIQVLGNSFIGSSSRHGVSPKAYVG